LSFSHTQWDLPGPAAFVAATVKKARATGVVAVIVPRHFPDDFETAIKDEPGMLELPVIDASSDEAPLAALSNAFLLPLKSARSLRSATAAQGRSALLAGIDAASLLRWETTLRAYLAGCDDQTEFGSVLILSAAPDCETTLLQLGIACLPWRNVISFRDSLPWALRERKITDPLLDRLAAETAVCLAGWELEEVSRQMERLSNVRAIFEAPAATTPRHDPSWAAGEIDDFDGIAFKRLALCDDGEIARRMWRAQVTVLFGWLETLRNDFVQDHDAWLSATTRLNPGALMTADQEWAALVHHARQTLPASDVRRRLAESARILRNALAHREAVSFEMVQNLTDYIRRLSQR